MEATHRSITPGDTLVIPQPRRLIHETARAADGGKIVNIYYNDLELTFDDPTLLSFGEKLLVTSRFTAAETMTWAGDDTYAWETVKELLETLVSQGFLQVQEPAPPRAERPRSGAAVCPVAHDATPAEAAPDPRSNARTWTPDECLSLSQEIFGVAVEPGNLECLIRSCRVAHAAIDAAGRQLGDENVYPPELQLSIPTEHRTCRYRGRRFEHELPMNVTGLELVQGAWGEVLQILRLTKREFLRRRPNAEGPPAGLSLLEVSLYASALLAFPAYLMHRADDRVPNGAIPSAVSALFRTIDGTRMTSRHMMLAGEVPSRHDLVPTPESFFLHAEKESLLLSSTGVCAGPPAMIEQFLSEVMNVAPADDAPGEAPVAGWSDFPVALDYALAACELEAVADQLWLAQARIIDDLLPHVVGAGDQLDALRRRLAASLTFDAMPAAIGHLYVQPNYRNTAFAMFGDLIDTCRRMRGLPVEPPAVVWRSDEDEDEDAAGEWLRRERPGIPDETARHIALAVSRLCTLEAQALPAMARRQAEVNRILGRAAPSREFTARDLANAWPAASLRSALTETLSIAIDVRQAPACAPPSALASPVTLGPAGFRTLRGLFARSRYSLESALWRLWGRSFDTELAAATAFHTLASEALPAIVSSPLDVLLRLFMVPVGVSRETFVKILRAEESSALTGSGLVTIRDDRVTSAFAVGSIDGMYFLTDTQSTIREGRRAATGPRPSSANELVMPAYIETYAFASKTHRHPVERALDLCTGSGVHALLSSRHAKHAVGSDLSARAIRFAEWNRRLNAIENVELVTGSVWEALQGRRFDRITVNPPYQPDSKERPGHTWWGAGPRGDGITSVIVGGLADHLALDGELQMIGHTLSWEDEDFEQQIARYLGPSAGLFDVRLDTEETPLSGYRKRYPDEALAGLVSAAYGVVTITRRSGSRER